MKIEVCVKISQAIAVTSYQSAKNKIDFNNFEIVKKSYYDIIVLTMVNLPKTAMTKRTRAQLVIITSQDRWGYR